MMLEANGGHTCWKDVIRISFYNHPDRLRTPLIKKNGAFVGTTWEEAYDFIAQKLTDIKRTKVLMPLQVSLRRGVQMKENYIMQKFIGR